MPKTLITLFFGLALILSTTTGCSQLNPPGDGQQPNWDQITVTVENFTELAARLVFANDGIKPYKEDICTGVSYVVPVLANFDDPDATFEQLHQLVTQTIATLPSDVLSDEMKEIVNIVANQILDVVFLYVQDAYSDAVSKDPTRAVLLVSRAVANGLDAACADGGLETFSITKSP